MPVTDSLAILLGPDFLSLTGNLFTGASMSISPGEIMYVLLSSPLGFFGLAMVWGIFGSSDDEADQASVEAVQHLADRLNTDDDPSAVTDAVDELLEEVDSITRTVELDRYTPRQVSRTSTALDRLNVLKSALENNRLDIQPAESTSDHPGKGTHADETDTLQGAAKEVRSRLSPSANVSRDLLDVAATGGSKRKSKEALREAVDNIESYHTLERALRVIDPSEPEIGSSLRTELDGRSGPISSSITELADALDRCRERTDAVESERKKLSTALKTVASAAAKAPGVDLEELEEVEGTPIEQARDLAAMARDGELFKAKPIVPRTAIEVKQSVSPESATATELLDGLSSPNQVGDLSETLMSAVKLIDEGATNRGAVGDIDRDNLTELLDQVESRLAELDGPVADELGRRTSELRRILDNADSTNTVGPYAVKQELRFYQRRLLESLENDSDITDVGSPADVDVTDKLDSVADIKSGIESRYINGRPDHNHSIPIHFLSLAEDLHSDAEDLASLGKGQQAIGLLDAAETVLNHIEQLYERNEYSVLLRRLRG